jgi:hypothetical protein
VGARFGGVKPTLAATTWNALVRPGLEWGWEVLQGPSGVTRPLDSVQPAALRLFTGADSFTSNEFLLAEFGSQSHSSRREELQLRFFHHLCTMDRRRMVAKVFLHRVQQVRDDDAPLSICRTYRDLLQRFGFLQAWVELPNDPQHAIWKQWEEKVHSRCVVDDHARRMASLSTKPHLSLYMTLKPSDRPCVSHYLQLRGLGPYLKLRLRSNSLPLMDMLQRYCKVPLTDAECECRLCDAGEREDVTHFIAACPSLAPQRAALLERLVADNNNNNNKQCIE